MEQIAFDEMQERLLESPYWIIDFLPRQVPQESGGQYFAVERYLMAHPQIDELYRRFARLLVKMSCYYDMAVYDPQTDVWCTEPGPEELAQHVEACAAEGTDRYLHAMIPTEDTLLTLEGNDLYMTIYHPRGELLETVEQLTTAEGLFLRAPLLDKR